MKKLILSFGLIITTLAVKAQSFLAPNNTREFSPYQSGVDVKLYEQVIVEKQRAYDYNLNLFRQELKYCYEDLNDLSQVDFEKYKSMKKFIDDWLLGIQKQNPDFSNNEEAKILNNTVRYLAKGVREAIRISR